MNGMNGIYLYFLNKHLSSWPLLVLLKSLVRIQCLPTILKSIMSLFLFFQGFVNYPIRSCDICYLTLTFTDDLDLHEKLTTWLSFFFLFIGYLTLTLVNSLDFCTTRNTHVNFKRPIIYR